MRVIVAAAGTGGHINPGLAIANKIKQEEKDSEIIFIGTNRGLENDLVPRAGYELKTIEAYGLSKKLSIDNIKKMCKTLGATSKARKIIKQLGATPVFMNAQEHDEAAAMISHMPMVVAQALFLAASENPKALEIAASGFRDMTRLALSNEEMAVDMVHMNAENIQNAILKLYQALGKLTAGNYLEIISRIKAERTRMFRKEEEV